MIAGLREKGVSDAVLRVLAAVPREQFLPRELRPRAYQDRALAIGQGQTCSQPWIVAVVIQALELAPGAAVLEVGAGSGYLAAVLRAGGAGRVVAVELRAELAARARNNLNRTRVDGVVVLVGDGQRGAPGWGPFDAAVISATGQAVPPAVMAELKPTGAVVAPLASHHGERLWRLRREGAAWTRQDLGECRFVPLLGGDGNGGGAS